MAIAKCETMMLAMYSRPSKASARFLSQCSTPTAGHGAGVPNRHVRHTGKVVGESGAAVRGVSRQDTWGDSQGTIVLLKSGHGARDACVLDWALLGRSWGGFGRLSTKPRAVLTHRPAVGVRRLCLARQGRQYVGTR